MAGKSIVKRGPDLPDLVAEIRTEVQAADDDLRSALKHAARAGELLIQAKDACGWGEWLPWLEENFEFSRSTAANYMRLAANVERVAHLDTVGAAIKELATPATARQLPQPLPIHPVCEIFPWVSAEEMLGMVESIAALGLLLPVTTWIDEEGQEWLIDGKIRRRACEIAGVRLETGRYQGTEPLEFVVSMNVRRKGLSESALGIVNVAIEQGCDYDQAELKVRSDDAEN
jgi:hypothetical protein